MTNRVSRAPTRIGTSLGSKTPLWNMFAPSFSKDYISHYHTDISVFNHILLIYVAYCISIVPYQCLKRILFHFKKGTIAPPAPSNNRHEGRLLPAVPSAPSLASLDLVAMCMTNVYLL